MKCEETMPLIDLLLDDELSPPIAAVAMEHLNTCPSCQEIWACRTALREQFQTLSKSIIVPENALTRLDARISKQAPVFSFKTRLPAMYAAALLICGLAALFFFNTLNNKPMHKLAPVTASEIVDKYVNPSQAVVKEASNGDVAVMSRQVGFPVAILDLPNWHLVSRQVVKLSGHSGCMVRLVYAGEVDGKRQELTAFEACQGQIIATGLKEHKMDGRIVCCGKLSNRSVVYFPKDGRDHLLISSIPEHDLMTLALRT